MSHRFYKILLSIFLLLVMAINGFCQLPDPSDFNTGNNGMGGKTPILKPDRFWKEYNISKTLTLLFLTVGVK